MAYYITKVIISALLIVLITEVAKRSSLIGAIIASLPVISILAFLWIHIETGDVQRIAELSRQIFWLVLPSLILFLALPILLKQNLHFYVALFLAMAMTSGAYLALFWMLKGKSL
ncbi:DUF3147 family protein [Thioalkalivibrio sulfidiphilus]|uniref:DUF3147 family protein n=1 Tax=Thioalkalivibrio sulfidiphilus TaxID=1033854 RepID=UPI003B367552